jgi:hypothetical protein
MPIALPFELLRIPTFVDHVQNTEARCGAHGTALLEIGIDYIYAKIVPKIKRQRKSLSNRNLRFLYSKSIA